MLIVPIICAFCLSMFFEEIATAPNTVQSPFLSVADFQMAEYLTNHPSMVHTNYSAMYNKNLFEGDITNTEGVGNAIIGHSPQISRTAVRDRSVLWANGHVPYIIHHSFNEAQRGAIAQAVEELHKKACIRFEPWNGIDEKYVHFQAAKEGCSSPVGNSGGGNLLNLGRGCFSLGTILHEILHTLGFHHEHNHPDRDKYVDIIWKNIEGGQEQNFKRRMAYEIDDLLEKYDYSSLMHYDMYAFGRGRQTIIPKDSNAKIGQREGFSEVDVRKMNKLYTCDDVSSCRDRDENCDQMSVLCETSIYVQQLCPIKCMVCKKTQCEDRGQWCKIVKKYNLCNVGKTPIRACPLTCATC